MKNSIWALCFALAASSVGASLTACGGKPAAAPGAPGAAGPSGSGSGTGAAAGQGSSATSGIESAFGTPDENTDLTGSARSDYEKGFAAWSNGELKTARDKFQSAQGNAPKSGAPGYALGIVLDRMGDPSGAEAAFRQSYTANPKSDRAVYAHAMMMANNQNRIGEAETFLNGQIAKSPQAPRLTAALAEIKSLQGDHTSAQKLAQDALRMNPDFKEAMVTVARDHYRAGKIELARYALSAVLDGFGDATPPRDKNNAEANLLRGLLEREMGRRPVAFAAFDAAAKRRPDLVEAQVQIGSMKLEAGNAQEAQPHLESATRFGPKNAYAHLNLGDCYRLLQRPEDAKREIDVALTLDSSLTLAHYDLGLLYLFTPKYPGLVPDKQVQTAIDEFEKYKAGQPKSGKGEKDDVDELIARAKAKQAELKAPVAAPAPAASAPAPAASGSAAPKKK